MRRYTLSQSLPEQHTSPATKRLRVLFVSASLTHGGAERVVSTLLGHLDRERYHPSLALMSADVLYPLPGDVSVTDLRKQKPWHIPRATWQLRQAIQSTRPDVIISNMMYTNWWTGAALASVSHKPRWIARFAVDAYSMYGRWFNAVMRPFIGHLLRSADAVVANSTALAERNRRYFQLGDQTVNVIFNPIDLGYIDAASHEPLDIEESEERPVVLAVGRLARQKRVDVLIDAFAQVRRVMPAALWICGDGPLHQHLQQRVAALELQDDVTFWGFQPNPYAFMRRASLFALTSDFEGMPNALIEAQALGLPAVSTRCPTGPDEIIEDGITGYLVPPGNVKALAEALLDLLSHPERRARMGRKGQQRVRQLFPVERIVSDWQHLLDRVAEGPGACVG